MKYFTIALFLGVISTKDLQVQELRNRLNALKISISKQGQRKIEKEANDVKSTVKEIKGSQPVRNLKSSLKRWGQSQEVMNIKKLDEEFMASEEGQRLIQEWKDVGKCLEEMDVFQMKKKGHFKLHIDNEHLDALADELTDVADQYKALEGSKWDKAYHEAWDKALSNKQAGAVGRRFEAFKESDEAKALKKEVKELKQALKQNVKVTDIPESWQDGMNMLKITVSKQGQKAIEKEATDIEKVGDAIKHSTPVQNLGGSLEKWAKSKEVKHLEELDKKFLASKEGQRLMKEWQDFGELLEQSIYHNDTGIHIPNSQMVHLSDELDDVADQYKALEGSEWDIAYKKGIDAAFSNHQAKNVGDNFEAFKQSNEGKALGKELMDLKQALKTHVKVTDIPEEWKKDMNMLKVTIKNKQDIESEWTDVENTWDKIEHSQPVRNLEGSLKKWGKSDEVDKLKELDAAFKASPEGKRLVAEWTDVFKTLEKSVYHNKSGFHIDNKELQHIEDELDDVADQYEQLEGSKWHKASDKAWEAALTNKEFGAVKRRANAFKESQEGQALKKEMMEFGESLKKNVEVTDIPEHWKKDMYLF